jgi:hypothetical protein
MERSITDRSRIIAQSLGYELPAIPEDRRELIAGTLQLIGVATLYDKDRAEMAIENGRLLELDQRFFASPKDLTDNGNKKYSTIGGWVFPEDLLVSTKRFEKNLVAPKIKIRKDTEGNPEILLKENGIPKSPFESQIFPTGKAVVIKPNGDILTHSYKSEEVRPLTHGEQDTLNAIIGHIQEKMVVVFEHPENPPNNHPLLIIGRSVKNIDEYHAQIRKLVV